MSVGNGSEMRIRISQLSNGIHEYRFTPEPSEIGLESNFGGSVAVDAVLDKTPRQIYLKADVRTTGLFQCDRCLEEFELPISGGFKTLYVYDELVAARDPGEDVQVITLDTVYLDLAEDVRQMVMLSVPLKLLCKTDCKGLCPHCGTDRNTKACSCKDEEIDARWEDLRKLIKN